MSTEPTRALLQFFGGRVCLDFRQYDGLADLRGAAGVAARLRHASPVERQARHLARAGDHAVAGRSPAAAGRCASVLDEARVLRAEICKAAEALCRGERVRPRPQPAACRSAGATAARSPRGGLCSRSAGKIPGGAALAGALVAERPARLEDAARLGFCQAEGCGWFFVDESPNHARTWCSSEVCGNRERARRAYAKRIRRG